MRRFFEVASHCKFERDAKQMQDVQRPHLAIDILRRLAKELDQSAGLVDDLHALVERSAWLDGAQNNEFVRSAQSIDILQQRLAELSHFVSELAELTPSHWVMESHIAAKKLKLSKLAEALNHMGDRPLPPSEHEAGEVEIF
jgi:hypothetical protein